MRLPSQPRAAGDIVCARQAVVPAGSRVPIREGAPWRKWRLPWGDRCTVGVISAGDRPGWCATHIYNAGGKAIELTPRMGDASTLMDGVDGLLVNGGPDVHPRYYGRELDGAKDCRFPDPRDQFALDCVGDALRRGMPMLGICKGQQLMNVAARGTLVQDIYTQWQHRGVALHRGPHFIRIVPGTQLAHVLGIEPLAVNSYHHQAVEDLGSGLRVTAQADDGVVEAIEGRRGQIGVQFHPEVMKSPRTDRLFQYLVECGAQYRSGHYATAA